MKFSITIIDNVNETKAQIPAAKDLSILANLIRAKVKIDHVCGGHATCGTCRFFLIEGELNQRTDLEMEMFEEREMQNNERLACQALLLENLVIKIPD